MLHLCPIFGTMVGQIWAKNTDYLLNIWIYYQQRRFHHKYVLLLRIES